MLLCGALGALIAGRAPRPLGFIAVAQLVPAGMTVTASDLAAVTMLPSAGLDAMPLRDASRVVGRRAALPLEPGSLLVPSDLTSVGGPPPGNALVGTSLSVNQMPMGLTAGQRVLVVLSGTAASISGLTPASGASGASSGQAAGSPTGASGSVLARATAISISVAGASSAIAGAAPTAFLVTLEVPEAEAASVAAASASGDVSLAALGGST